MSAPGETRYRWRTRPRLTPGVNVFGYVFAEHGVGEGVRQLVRVAEEAGLPCAVVPYEVSGSRQEADFDGVPRETIYDVNLICINADTVDSFVALLGAEVLVGRYNVGLWCWEVESVPPWMAASARFFDEIWACSTYTARTLAAALSVPVLPWAWPLSAAAGATPARRSRHDGDFRFLFCFDYNSVFERKNPVGLVDAFRRAFAPGAGARLLLKSVNGERFPVQEARLLEACAGHPDVEVVDGYLPRTEQRALMAGCDAYVSLHRAEGLGITMAEAMALGKPVIATAYSGNLDFMDESNGYLVPYRRSTIPPGCGPYPAGSVWAEPDLEVAAVLLRRVFEDPAEAVAKGERAARDLAGALAPRARSAFPRRRLAAIRETFAGRRPTPGPFVTVEHRGGPPDDIAVGRQGFRRHADAGRLLAAAPRFSADRVIPGLPCGALDGARCEPDGTLHVWGWAQDPRRGDLPSSVVLLVDGRQVPLRIGLGGTRPDVEATFGRASLRRSGWSCRLPASVARGRHRLEAYVALEDGSFGFCGFALPA